MAALDELNLLMAINNLEEMEPAAEVRREHNNRVYDAFDMSDIKFVRMFRLSKDLARDLINLLSEYLIQPTRASALNVQNKVLIALRFYATGSYQMDTAINKYLNVSQSSVSRAVNEVSAALNNPTIFNSWVKFPQNFAELDRLRNEFFNRYGFPGIIGCVDCTHIALVAPPRNDPLYPEHIFVNRKNYHSINTQLICDPDLKILNVNARYPGSTHDSFIWANSFARATLEAIHRRGHAGYHVLGDSGYPLRTYCMTPFEQPLPHSPEDYYSLVHRTIRCSVERCNGLLKMRFRCLLKHRVLHYAPPIVAKIIKACTVLHNMCIAYNVPEPEPEPGDEYRDFGIMDAPIVLEEPVDPHRNRDLLMGEASRQRIVANYFQQ